MVVAVEEALLELESFSEQREYHWLEQALGRFLMRGVEIPEEKIVFWAMKALSEGSYKGAAQILSAGRCIYSKLFETKKIINAANICAGHYNDHATPRLLFIILKRIRPKKYGRLSLNNAKMFAHIVGKTFEFSDSDNRDFMPNVLLGVLKDHLRPADFALVAKEYRREINTFRDKVVSETDRAHKDLNELLKKPPR